MPIGRLIVITTWGDSLHCNNASIVSSKGRGGRRCCSVNWSYTECTNAFVAECIDLLSPLLCAFLMISEMLLLQKQGAAFPQPSRAIYCGKVIISLRLKKKKEKRKRNGRSDLRVRMWARSLKPQRSSVALPVVSNPRSQRRVIGWKRAIKAAAVCLLKRTMTTFLKILLTDYVKINSALIGV